MTAGNATRDDLREKLGTETGLVTIPTVRKSGRPLPEPEWLGQLALYGVPLWGILHRSAQAPDSFLGIPLRVLPVAPVVVDAVAAVALVAVGAWIALRVASWWRGELPVAHTLYVASHHVIFATGYLWIENLDHGWLVLNVWHNAQYILFVWLYNNNRFKEGVVPGQRLISTISQSRNWPFYFLTCLLISTVWYFGLDEVLRALQSRSTLPLFLVAYQTINFHHYVVDGVIWKVRKKKLRRNLGISEES